MNTPEFREKDTQQAWADYFLRVDALCSALNARQRRDIQLEIKAHLLESFVHHSEGSESERLRTAIERLGPPDDFVPGWVQDRLLHDAAPGGSVRNLWQLFRVNAVRGATHFVASLAIGFGYFAAFYFFIMAALKPFFPDNVGLISTGNGLIFLGYVDSPEMIDHLGYWLTPLGLFLSILLVWFLGRMNRYLSRT